MTKMQAKAKLNANGRVVIPAPVRKALDLRPGDELIMRVEDGELRLSTRRRALERARRMIRQYIPDDVDLTQSLIDDRRAEAERE
jgi:AbrB family looped-hinge helix DNA binding protein